MNDPEVRGAFDKLLWVSVGQEPDVRELQASLLQQVNDGTLPADLADGDVLREIKKVGTVASVASVGEVMILYSLSLRLGNGANTLQLNWPNFEVYR